MRRKSRFPLRRPQVVKSATIQSSEISDLLQAGLAIHRLGRLDDAKQVYEKILKKQPNHFDAIQLLATIYTQTKQFELSLKYFDKALQIKKTNPAIFNNRGLALQNLDRLNDALNNYDIALRIKPDYAEALNNRGNVLKELKQPDDALKSYDDALRIKPDYAEAFYNRSLALLSFNRLDDALKSCDDALRIKPSYIEALINRGNLLQELKRLDEALKSYDDALRIIPDHAEALNNRGNVLKSLNRLDDALKSFDNALRINPDYAEAFYNRGNVLKELERLNDALKNFDDALRINPDYAEAFNNRGNVLMELNRQADALKSYDDALRIKPDYAEAFYNQGLALQNLNRLDDALKSYDDALDIKRDYEFLLGTRQHTRMNLCIWSDYEKTAVELKNLISAGTSISSPFPILGLIDDLKLQLRCSEIYTESTRPRQKLSNVKKSLDTGSKPRIGYFSADFHDHATLHLMLEIFKNHSNSLFDFYAFSFGPQTNDPWQKEVKKYFVEFINVREKSDTQVVELSRQLGIDIAVDLKGFTYDGRPSIFANRAAPIQISYLGYPGTMGADYIDYIIADRVVIPEEYKEFYKEKVLYLPNCYQPNITNRRVSEKDNSRKDMGLPESATVFCSFNNPYKITPNMFSIWLEILKSVDSSVLWILCASNTAKNNLIQFANSHGVDSSRIVFASHLPIEEHLKRLPLADVFLDTYPYNAHTTASDSVRMGVPIVTLAGQSFASRVAASILSAVNMQELIVNTPEDYKHLAIRLGSDRGYLQSIKKELETNLLQSPLFDSVTFTRDLEKIYASLISFRN